MRIRKRAVPLPLSLLSPVPFSDLHLRLVQLPPSGFSQPSDHLLPSPPHNLRPLIRRDPDADPDAAAFPPPPQPHNSMELEGCKDDKCKEKREKCNDTSKQSMSGAATDNGVAPQPSPPYNKNQVVAPVGRWCDGDKAMPLKKRKARFETNGMVVTGEAKMKCKTNKIDTEDDDDDEEEEDDDDDDDNKKKRKKSKKSSIRNGGGAKKSSKCKKGGSMMEGSRCSRVNGRGWRCMQPTLVGYSLCEHHLGKGRLRSMSGVRFPAPSSSEKPSSATLCSSPSLNSHEKSEESLHDDDHKKAVANKRRMKLGVVKARSLSSLLCQPNTVVVEVGATSEIKQPES